MKPPTYQEQVKTLIRAKCLVLWTTTTEEQRAERALIEAAAQMQMKPYSWTITTGTTDHTTGRIDSSTAADPLALFSAEKRNTARRELYIIKDAAEYINQQPGLRRYIRDEMSDGKRRPAGNQKAYIFIDTAPPPESIPGIMRAPLPLPTRDELEALLTLAIDAAPDEIQSDANTPGTRAAILDAMTGLDTDTARNALLKSRVTAGKFDPAVIAEEKKSYIKSDALQWIDDPDPRGLDAIGGLEILKSDLIQTRAAFSPDARRWGLPAPKGALIVGIPGSGKSLTAKATATAWRLPLIKFNLSAVYGKYVGDSEQGMRNALKILDAAAPAVIWLDEIEKALAGTGGAGDGDGGTSKRVFGEFLTWTQERAGRLYLIATANDIAALPPELKRAGRFDAIYFVDAPHAGERAAIVEVMKRKHPRTGGANTDAIAAAAAGYTGAEIETAFEKALYIAYNDGQREPTTADIISGLEQITPILKTDAAKLESLREWARTSARPASRPETVSNTNAAGEFTID
ncbi:MAG: ATP-dependent zinc metalloprotease FtsH [bacterium ADurb.Bin236]|nr:MAG: ATP-dependent zinc metalloprotease FtsH [bacterium ADurb.Bin236]